MSEHPSTAFQDEETGQLVQVHLPSMQKKLQTRTPTHVVHLKLFP